MLHDLSISTQSVVGVFLEGKHLKAGRIRNYKIEESVGFSIDNLESDEVIIDNLIQAIEQVFNDEVVGIGVGVPSVVDVAHGIVFSPQNIPSWTVVHLGDILARRFNVRVYVNNDANCFAVGEKYFGKGRKYRNMVGIVCGSGMGMGIIIDDKLYSGDNGGAGEFGFIPYKDHDYEYYCTTGYFEKKYGLKAEKLYARLKKEDKISLAILEQFGLDFGHAIMTILFSVDPGLIVVGGEITKFFPYFEQDMWKVMKKFPYPFTIEKLRIEVSEEPNIEILGAAALYFDAQKM